MKEDLAAALKFFKDNFESHSISLKGKQYTQVNFRLGVFRQWFPHASILTNLIADEPYEVNGNTTRRVVIKAWIDIDGVTVATGYAEEWQHKGMVNATSHIENCETSAIGRALANLGFGGSEFASVEEIDIAKAKNQALEPQAATGGYPPKLQKFYDAINKCHHIGHLSRAATEYSDFLDSLTDEEKDQAREIYNNRHTEITNLKEGKHINE